MQKFLLVVLWVGQGIVMKGEQDRDRYFGDTVNYQKSCLKIAATVCLWYFGKEELIRGRKDTVYLNIYCYFQIHLKATRHFILSRDNFGKLSIHLWCRCVQR